MIDSFSFLVILSPPHSLTCWMSFSAKTQAIQGIIDNLQISTLEYRNESDHDVCPYVHDRKVELIEVQARFCVFQNVFQIHF